MGKGRPPANNSLFLGRRKDVDTQDHPSALLLEFDHHRMQTLLNTVWLADCNDVCLLVAHMGNNCVDGGHILDPRHHRMTGLKYLTKATIKELGGGVLDRFIALLKSAS